MQQMHVISAHGLLHPHFQASIQHALCCTGPSSFGTPHHQTDPLNPTILEEWALKRWEAILHFMVNTGDSATSSSYFNAPAKSVLQLLKSSGLMDVASDADTKYYRSNSKKTLSITNKGFQFLLLDTGAQVWTLLLQYVSVAETDPHFAMDKMQVLAFFFQLACMQLGYAYSMHALSETQCRLVDDLRELGVVYYQPNGKKDKFFYPTRLATQLMTMSQITTTSTTTTTTDSTNESQFLVIETNYRVYAYTQSPLQISIMALFIQLKYRFPNLIVGIMTRESVNRALMNGITASQIVHYLRTHAHTNMITANPVHVLPPTIVDQVNLWEQERKRLKFTSGYLYREFSSTSHFNETVQYAKDMDVFVWCSSGNSPKTLVVTEEGHVGVRAFVKNLLAGEQA